MTESRFSRLRAWAARNERPLVATLATLALGIAIVLVVLLFGIGENAPAPTAQDDSTQPAAPSDAAEPSDPASPATTPSPARVGPWTPPSVNPASVLTLNEWAMTPGAPVDTAPTKLPDGAVVTPGATGTLVYDKPEGDVLGLLPTEQIAGQAATYPVLAEQDEWLNVMLPTRRGMPSEAGEGGVNEATGWVYRPDVSVSNLDTAIVVNLANGTITLQRNGTDELTAEAQVNGANTPTPATRTFVLGTYSRPAVTFSNLSIGLGAHSGTLDSYRTTPASIAIEALTLGSDPVADSCIRVSLDTLERLKDVPAGTPVLIEAGS